MSKIVYLSTKEAAGALARTTLEKIMEKIKAKEPRLWWLVAVYERAAEAEQLAKK